MAEGLNFSDLANVKAKDVEKPKPLPLGHYLVQQSGPMKDHKAKSGNIAFRFPFKIIAALDDVDQEALAAAGGIPEKREFTVDFWMSLDARWRFTELCAEMGFSDDLNLIELAEAFAGYDQPLIAEGKYREPMEGKENDPPFFYIDNLAVQKD